MTVWYDDDDGILSVQRVELRDGGGWTHQLKGPARG